MPNEKRVRVTTGGSGYPGASTDLLVGAVPTTLVGGRARPKPAPKKLMYCHKDGMAYAASPGDGKWRRADGAGRRRTRSADELVDVPTSAADAARRAVAASSALARVMPAPARKATRR